MRAFCGYGTIPSTPCRLEFAAGRLLVLLAGEQLSIACQKGCQRLPCWSAPGFAHLVKREREKGRDSAEAGWSCWSVDLATILAPL